MKKFLLAMTLAAYTSFAIAENLPFIGTKIAPIHTNGLNRYWKITINPNEVNTVNIKNCGEESETGETPEHYRAFHRSGIDIKKERDAYYLAKNSGTPIPRRVADPVVLPEVQGKTILACKPAYEGDYNKFLKPIGVNDLVIHVSKTELTLHRIDGEDCPSDKCIFPFSKDKN